MTDALPIDLADLHKTYRGRVHALRGVSLQVRPGEIFGLLGPNGAGKSTLVKVLMTVIRPSRCAGSLLGRPIGDKHALRRVGYLPEHHRFPEYLTAAQVLDYCGGLADVPRAIRRQRTEPLLRLVGIADWAHKRVRSFSKGMRQRLGIAQALINDPALVLLDEPTDGVDPVGRRDIRTIVLQLKDQGRSVLINSHLLSELEMVCDRVAILVQGRVRMHGTLEELTTGQRRYDIELAADPDTARRWAHAALPDALDNPTHHPACSLHNATLRIASDDEHLLQPVIDALRARGAVIRSITRHRPSLEDLFLQAVTDPRSGRTLPPGAAPDGDAP